MKRALVILACFAVTSCGSAYISPSVNPIADSGSKVRVVPLNPETVLVANRSSFTPKTLPSVFFQTAGTGGAPRGIGALPSPIDNVVSNAQELELRVPPPITAGPYRIGVGDVVRLATPQTGAALDPLSGQLPSGNGRQSYTVQDDGMIAIPQVGRVAISGMTLSEAEDHLFKRMVENQIDPTFSLEISEFNSKRVSVGGAVGQPTVVPVTLTPLFLDEVLTKAGGIAVEDQDVSSVRIYRDGTLYQIPLSALYTNDGLAKLQIQDGDSVFVDTQYQLEHARTYFEQQITLAETRQNARLAALNALQIEVNLRRNALADARSNFKDRVALDAVARDYVYLTGEVEKQSRFALPFGQRATLADALFGAAGGIPTRTGNVREIYVLRASDNPRDFGAVTAWQLDGRAASNLTLATRFELRPNDVVFVAEQPVTRWNRVVSQITPSLISLGANAAGN